MESNWKLVTNFTVAMLAIINPLEKIPLWVAAAEDEKQKFQWFLAILVIFSCALILLFFLWLGRDLFLKLHIGLASFNLTGLENVSQIHDLHVWPLSTTEVALTVYLIITNDDLKKGFLSRVQ